VKNKGFKMSQKPDIITWKSLERANKVAIIVMTAAFLGISGLLVNAQNKAKTVQVAKTQMVQNPGR
jgi:cell division protein FtsL